MLHDILSLLWVSESDQSLQEKNWDSEDRKFRLIFSSHTDNFILPLPLFKSNEANPLFRVFSRYFPETKHCFATYLNKIEFQEKMRDL